MAAMARSYQSVEATARREIGRLTKAIAAREVAGEQIPASWLAERGRLTTLTSQIARELGRFSNRAGPLIERERGAAAELAFGHAPELARSGMLGTARLVPARVEAITAALDAPAPLSSLLGEIGADAADRLEDVFRSGVALGRGPRLIARDAMQAVEGLPRARAQTIARTETLRAYREASRATWQANSRVVAGWQWFSSTDVTTCASCWAMHGSSHTLDEPMETHPSCRCTMVPVPHADLARDLPQIEPGPDLFDRLPDADRLSILGRSKLDALDAGEIELGDLVKVRTDPRWGVTRSEAGLKEARGRRGR